MLVAALWIALLVDALLGEPAPALHPVVAIGRYLQWTGRRLPERPPMSAFAAGAAAWWLGAGVIVILACAVQALVAAHLPAWAGALVLGLALKPLLAWRMLKTEVQAVEQALARSLDAGRERLSYLVSRDVTHLTESEVRESAIESLAENLNDSVVAPIFWFALLGLPGAALYRFANTADAMWGYPGMRGGRDWQWAGKWAARADDVLSWVPARITAALLIGLGVHVGWGTLRTEAGRTPSPNSGWPMAAMALRLGVRLRKPGVYGLNAQGRAPKEQDTSGAINSGNRVVLAVAVGAALVMSLIGSSSAAS
jgi:adenosylcobinamide-phosphate synthase